jgi:hypothetical protein
MQELFVLLLLLMLLLLLLLFNDSDNRNPCALNGEQNGLKLKNIHIFMPFLNTYIAFSCKRNPAFPKLVGREPICGGWREVFEM